MCLAKCTSFLMCSVFCCCMQTKRRKQRKTNSYFIVLFCFVIWLTCCMICDWVAANWQPTWVFEKTFSHSYSAVSIQRKTSTQHWVSSNSRKDGNFRYSSFSFFHKMFLFILLTKYEIHPHPLGGRGEGSKRKVASSLILSMNWCFNQRTLEFRLNLVQWKYK